MAKDDYIGTSSRARLRLSQICWAIFGLSLLFMVIVFVLFDGHTHETAIITVLFSVASSFLSASMAILIFDLLLKRDIDAEGSREVEKSIAKHINKNMRIRSAGIEGIHDRFYNERFIQSIRRSKNVFILQTYPPNLADIRSGLLECLNNGGCVKLAMLDPESSYVDIRSSETPETHKTRDDFSNYIRLYETRFRDIAHRKSNGTAIIGFYDRSPGICIYGTDELIMISAFLSNQDAISSPQIEIAKGSSYYEYYLEHFHSVWDKIEEPEEL